jgi:hypothetical protein
VSLVTPLQQPDQQADKEQDAEHRCDCCKHPIAEKSCERSKYAALRHCSHRNAKPRGKIGVREIEAYLTFESDRDCRNSGVDLGPLDRIEKTDKIVVVLAKLERDVQLAGNAFPQIDAQPAPFPIVAPQDEGWHTHGANHDLGRFPARL